MIGISNKKALHSLSVAKKMKKMAESTIPPLPKQVCEDLFLLGYLHDIGYEFVNDPKEHAHVGGMILNHRGFKYWQEVYCHGDPDATYNSDALLLLNIADLTIDSEGNDVGVEKRLEDICNRYGKESEQFINAERLTKKIGLIQNQEKPIKLQKGCIDLKKI